MGMELTTEQIGLTEKLYSHWISAENFKQLHQEGACLNYIPQNKLFTPLYYWILTCSEEMPPLHTSAWYSKYEYDSDKVYSSLKKVTTLLELGAKTTPREGGLCKYYPYLLDYCMIKQHNNELETLLKFKPTKIDNENLDAIWGCTITKKNHQYVDLLGKYFTPNELQQGLDYCIEDDDDYDIIKGFEYCHEDYEKHLPIIMQKLISHGANPTIALCLLMKKFPSFTYPTHRQHPFAKKVIFLCNNGASDEEALHKMVSIHDAFDLMINAMKTNLQSDSGKTEI
jgi:hypothetical protein